MSEVKKWKKMVGRLYYYPDSSRPPSASSLEASCPDNTEIGDEVREINEIEGY